MKHLSLRQVSVTVSWIIVAECDMGFQPYLLPEGFILVILCVIRYYIIYKRTKISRLGLQQLGKHACLALLKL